MQRNKIFPLVPALGLTALGVLSPQAAWALDSYRWLRVTIETPWAIFLFLLPMVLIPLILMVVLYWRFSFGKKKGDTSSRRGRPAPAPSSLDEPKS